MCIWRFCYIFFWIARKANWQQSLIWKNYLVFNLLKYSVNLDFFVALFIVSKKVLSCYGIFSKFWCHYVWRNHDFYLMISFNILKRRSIKAIIYPSSQQLYLSSTGYFLFWLMSVRSKDFSLFDQIHLFSLWIERSRTSTSYQGRLPMLTGL